MTVHLYSYLSKEKIDLIYEQLNQNQTSEITTEIGGELPIVSGKITRTLNTEKSRMEKAEKIYEELSASRKVGRLKESCEYMADELFLDWGMIEGISIWKYTWFDPNPEKLVLYRLLMYGSANNLFGYHKNNDLASGSCRDEVLTTLKRAIELELDKSAEITDIVFNSINAGNMDSERGFAEHYFTSAFTEKWQVVETMFRKRDMGSLPMSPINQRFLARVDYRETITIDHYKKYYGDLYATEREMGWGLLRPETIDYRMPKEVQKIVYICASPIFTENVQHLEKIQIINGRRLLYISPEDKAKFAALHQYSSLDQICDWMRSFCMEKEADQLMLDFIHLYYANEQHGMSREQYDELLSKYITEEKPL